MKRVSLYVLLLTLVSVLSCQKDRPAEDDYADVNVVVDAPSAVSTKAMGDGTKAGNLVFAVFDEAGAELPELRQGDWTKSQSDLVFVAGDDGRPQAMVKVRLAKGKSYTFVCWAQNKSLSCYDFSDMNNIRVDYAKDNVSNNEDRDAFYACVETGVVTGDVNVSATLVRPLMQLNVGTSPEDLDAARAAGLDVKNLYIAVSVDRASSKLVTDHEALAYTTSTAEADIVAPAFAAGKAVVSGSYPDAGREMLVAKLTEGKKEYEWLGMNYVLTSIEPDDTRTVTITLYEGTPENPTKLQLVRYEVPNVTFQANRKTNILGNLLTSDGQIEVHVSEMFDNEFNGKP